MSSSGQTSGRDHAKMVKDASSKVLTQYKLHKVKLLVSLFCANIVVFGVLTCFVLAGRKGLEDAYKRDIMVIQEEAGNIALFDEILTMSCRMTAWSGDESWEERYIAYVEPIDNSISRVIDMVPAIAHTFVTTTQSANDALIAMETDVLETYRSNMTAAQAIVEGDEYAVQKGILLDGLEVLYAEIRAEAQRNQDTQQERGDVAIVCLFVFTGLYVVVGVLLFWSAKFHSHAEQQRLFKTMVRMFNENRRKHASSGKGGASTSTHNGTHSGTHHGTHNRTYHGTTHNGTNNGAHNGKHNATYNGTAQRYKTATRHDGLHSRGSDKDEANPDDSRRRSSGHHGGGVVVAPQRKTGGSTVHVAGGAAGLP